MASLGWGRGLLREARIVPAFHEGNREETPALSQMEEQGGTARSPPLALETRLDHMCEPKRHSRKGRLGWFLVSLGVMGGVRGRLAISLPGRPHGGASWPPALQRQLLPLGRGTSVLVWEQRRACTCPRGRLPRPDRHTEVPCFPAGQGPGRPDALCPLQRVTGKLRAVALADQPSDRKQPVP